MREGVSLYVHPECVGCVLHVAVESCGMQVEEGKRRVEFLKDECRASVWSGYGEAKA